MALGPETLRRAIARIAADPTYSAYTAVANLLHELTPEASGLPTLKVAISRNFTIDAVIPIIEGELARAGFHPSVYLGEYDAISPDLLDPQSALYAFQPDFIVIAHWLESLAPQFSTRFAFFSSTSAMEEVDRLLAETQSRLKAVRQCSRATILLNNFLLPAYPALGILDAQSEMHQVASIIRLNSGLRQIAREFPDVYVVDLMTLGARIGHDRAFDERYWHIGRAPLSRVALLALAKEYVKFVRALRGRAYKCLVLDCDNTLWGGVIGEDGIAGIKLGSTYPGSCYEAFQREILNLKDRGVLLSLCSKNNEADVLDVLRNHPEMLLRVEHFATWQVNWDDKVTNLRRIADRLNIALDSIVFADDSRFECDFVRESLPEVEVLHLGDEPSAFARLLNSAACFDSLTLSQEDRVRTEMYQADAKRQELRQSASSLSEYLEHLQIVATIGKADEFTIPRIAQLTQKSNQFNLTTLRYSEDDIRILSAGSAEVFYMKLCDRVSDLGLVGVAILKRESKSIEIDTFLLSCRALGRRAEEVLLAHCLQSAAAAGVARVSARYRRTSKNSQVADFYGRCGFAKVSETAEESAWEFCFDQNSFRPPEWIQVKIGPFQGELCRPPKTD